MAIKKVGSAHILREVGRGGMGVVYEAEQEELGRRVAIKELPAETAANKDFAERFRREGRAHAVVRHAAIPVVFDLVEKGDALYLVTEFVDGADLQKILQQGGPLPADNVAHVGAVVADALQHVHARSLLHRDIKPSNVMVTLEGEVKLMDFGIAKDVTAMELTQEGMLVGSPPYVAPEILAGKGASPASDVWALGVTLYELLAGERPFKGKEPAELFANIARARHEPLRRRAPGVPRPLANAVEKCLELRPDKRWRNAGELSRALQTMVGWMTPEVDPSYRLVALLVDRDVLKVDMVTVMDSTTLQRTRQLDLAAATRPRRWPWVLVATMGAAAAATGFAVARGMLVIPDRWPF